MEYINWISIFQISILFNCRCRILIMGTDPKFLSKETDSSWSQQTTNSLTLNSPLRKPPVCPYLFATQEKWGNIGYAFTASAGRFFPIGNVVFNTSWGLEQKKVPLASKNQGACPVLTCLSRDIVSGLSRQRLRHPGCIYSLNKAESSVSVWKLIQVKVAHSKTPRVQCNLHNSRSLLQPTSSNYAGF